MRWIDGVADAALRLPRPESERAENRAHLRAGTPRRARIADATGPAGWMIVFKCVSSKSKTWLLMPFISAACRTSSALAASEHRGLRRARERGEGGNRDVQRLMPRSANRTAYPIEQRARGFLAHR